MQVDRKNKVIRGADGVFAKFGVVPTSIPDYLALVGDSADGYPGIDGIGPKGAASLITRYGPIEAFPAEVLGERSELADCSRSLQHCAPMRPCSRTSMRSAGMGRQTPFPTTASASRMHGS